MARDRYECERCGHRPNERELQVGMWPMRAPQRASENDRAPTPSYSTYVTEHNKNIYWRIEANPTRNLITIAIYEGAEFAESDLLIEMTVTPEVAANVANTMLAVINQK